MGEYPVLQLIVRYGSAGAAVASVIVFALVLWLGFPYLGWPVLPVGAFAGLLLFIVGKSYAEIVRLITEMLLPR